MSSRAVRNRNVLVAYWYLRRLQNKRKFWVNPVFHERQTCSAFVLGRELEKDEAKFKGFYRMSRELFKELAEKLRSKITKKDTNRRRCISVEEKLLITLRYLGSGCSFSSLSFYFARGNCTIGRIVKECCRAIWTVLINQYMPVPDKARWIQISQRFEALWNLPNCIGALDGKHIRINKLPGSGSMNFNYKSFHSIVLMATADADGNFITIETGYPGRNSDGGIFRDSRMNYSLQRKTLDLPEPRALLHYNTESRFPFYFVADEAFPLKKNLMRPYPKRRLNNTTRIFNYRLSRGRKCVECAFGMMSQKFQILLKAITCKRVSSVIDIVKAVCLLHNFIRKREGNTYSISDHNNDEHDDFGHQCSMQVNNIAPVHDTSNPQQLRDHLSQYFLTPNSALPWQWKYCVIENV